MEFSRLYFWIIYLTAFALALIFTPLSIKIAVRTGAMDVPKDARRVHTHPIPRIGGMAIFIGVTAAVLLELVLKLYLMHKGQLVPMASLKLTGIITGGVLIYLLGLADDLKGLAPMVKLAGQVACAGVAYAFGIRLTFIQQLFGDVTFSGVICCILTILWIVAIVNTINLVDGVDGLAAGIVAIASLCIAYVAYNNGYYTACFAMLATAGGAMGFLPYNFYPAKTFMGDGGSLFLGFMIASISLIQPMKGTTVVAILIPGLVLALPIFDTLFAIFRRLVNRKPIMEADKGHIHHRLMKAGMGQRRTVLCMYGICGIMGIAAVLLSEERYVEMLGLCAVAVVYLAVVLTEKNKMLPSIRENKTKPDASGKANGGGNK